jgi:hypothetical protein
MTKRRLPDVYYNPVTAVGAALAAVSFAAIVFFTFIEFLQKESPAYIGVIAYVALPVPLFIGIVLVFFGVWRERRRIARGLPASRRVFTLDLNSPRQRRALTVFAVAAIVFFLFTAYGSYRAFEWTESTEFCGATCHPVMEPEFTAYQNSPHARVRCVDCHVGSGAGWYVKSKLSGAYQVYATLANVYPRPIPTPVQNLRPAQETCEQCHWPSHFAGDKKVVNSYFRTDSANTPWTVALLIKTGGGTGPRSGAGIHWHMNVANEVTYVSTDSLNQTIPWVRFRSKATGETTEFFSSEAGAPIEELKKLPMRTMDCIDCHNRPSHIYRPPVRIVDASLKEGRISTELPSVRTPSIEALTAPYSSTASAMDSIPMIFRAFYEQNYPAVLTTKAALIVQATDELKHQYRMNFFPAMGVSWKVYPNNIGHMTDLGCFRCHDGKHVSPAGKPISKDCNVCHTILFQGIDPAPTTLSAQGLEFQHPEEVGEMWKEANCRDCHTGQ